MCSGHRTAKHYNHQTCVWEHSKPSKCRPKPSSSNRSKSPTQPLTSKGSRPSAQPMRSTVLPHSGRDKQPCSPQARNKPRLASRLAAQHTKDAGQLVQLSDQGRSANADQGSRHASLSTATQAVFASKQMSSTDNLLVRNAKRDVHVRLTHASLRCCMFSTHAMLCPCSDDSTLVNCNLMYFLL